MRSIKMNARHKNVVDVFGIGRRSDGAATLRIADDTNANARLDFGFGHKNEASLSSSPDGGAVGVTETGTALVLSLMNKSPLVAALRNMSKSRSSQPRTVLR